MTKQEIRVELSNLNKLYDRLIDARNLYEELQRETIEKIEDKEFETYDLLEAVAETINELNKQQKSIH